MPLHTGEALVLRTYRLGESDRLVVMLTRDRGKKRGVAKRRGAVPETLWRGARAVHPRTGGVLRSGNSGTWCGSIMPTSWVRR